MAIKLKRGLNANLAGLTLAEGEPAFTTDSGKLYIGSGAGKVLINPDYPEVPNMTEYALKSYVTSQGYITNSALTGYATEAFVTGKGYLTSSALTPYRKITDDIDGGTF